MGESITLIQVSEEQWPTSKSDRQDIHAFITHGQGMLMREDDGTIQVYDDEWLCSPEQAVPLSYARVLDWQLVDVRYIATDEEKKQYPAMLCDAARKSGGKLALAPILKDVVRVLTEDRDCPLPTYTSALGGSIETAQDILQRVRSIGELRLKPVLETLVARVEAELPTEFALIDTTLPEGRVRQRYYALHHILYAAHTLLHWYTVKTLYIVKTVSLDSSVGTRYDILSSDRHRAEVEFAALYTANRPYAADIDQWELLANDTVLRVAKRLELYSDLYDLSREWDDRTDEAIIYWRM